MTRKPFRGNSFTARADSGPTEIACAGPGRVTGLREHGRRGGRYVVEVEGVALAPVSVEAIATSAIRVGGTVDASDLERLLVASRETACYDRAVDSLARRSRSRVDLQHWLAQRGFAPHEIGVTLERLVELGVIDDLAFARGRAHTLAVGRGFGLRRVATELHRHGISDAVVRTVLEELRERTGGDERVALEAAATRRARSLTGVEPAVARRRLVGWLVRRGFGAGEAAGAATRALSGA